VIVQVCRELRESPHLPCHSQPYEGVIAEATIDTPRHETKSLLLGMEFPATQLLFIQIHLSAEGNARYPHNSRPSTANAAALLNQEAATLVADHSSFQRLTCLSIAITVKVGVSLLE